MFLIADFIALLLLQMRIEINTHFFCIAVKPSENFVKVQVHTESSGLARTLQSAYALHAGLFPVGSVPSREPGVYVPVPVYSRPTGRDLFVRGTMCAFLCFFWGGEGWRGWAKRWVQCGWTCLCARKRLESQSKWICSHIVWILSAMYIHMHKYHISIMISRSLFLSLCRIDEIHRHEKTCFLLHPPDASSMSHGV